MSNRVDETWNLLIGLAALGGGIASVSGPQFSGFNALQIPEIPMVILNSGDYKVLGYNSTGIPVK